MHSKTPHKLDRRKLLSLGTALGSGIASAGWARDGLLGEPGHSYQGFLPWQEGAADAPTPATTGEWTFLTEAEAAFLTAASDRLIPHDPTGPSASEAGVPEFIDRQLAGPYGQGNHFFLGGPWKEGTSSQGYQSRFAPAQFYRHAIPEIERFVGNANPGKAFKDLSPDQQDALLKQMEAGTLKLDGNVDAKAFFTMFLQNVKEGYFSDPLYGGNKGASAWKMIGFPGAHYDYTPWVKAYNQRVPVETVGLLGRAGWKRG
jgi:gluconate 2-dehydrogenase gamma chain